MRGFVVILMLLLVSGGLLWKSGHLSRDGQISSPFDRVAWVDGTCLVSKLPDLRPGTPVQVIVFDEPGKPQKIVSTRIRKLTDSEFVCDPLFSDRKLVNKKQSTFFYQIEDREGALFSAPVRMPGIAIHGIDLSRLELVDGRIETDLDANGEKELYFFSPTGEGFVYQVKPKDHLETTLWEAYYYIGYDL